MEQEVASLMVCYTLNVCVPITTSLYVGILTPLVMVLEAGPWALLRSCG